MTSVTTKNYHRLTSSTVKLFLNCSYALRGVGLLNVTDAQYTVLCALSCCNFSTRA